MSSADTREKKTSRDFISIETRNALSSFTQLVLATTATMAIAVMVRIYIPRRLGAESYGSLYFAESVAAIVLIFSSLGIDTLVRRETATNSSFTNDFLGAIVSLRALIGATLIPLMGILLLALDRTWKEVLAVTLFGIGHVLASQTNTVSAILQARHRLSFLTTINISTKIIWAAALLPLLARTPEYVVIAIAFVLNEAVRLAALVFHHRKKSGLQFGAHIQSTRQVLLLSAPFFAHQIIYRLYERIDGQVIAFFSSRMETGWYGASSNIITSAMLLIPVANGALVPFMARLAQSAPERLAGFTEISIRIVMLAGGISSLLLWINAKSIVDTLFGQDYAPSVPTLQIMSTLIPITYLASFATARLIQDNHSWSATKVSLLALGINPILSIIGVRFFLERMGTGGAGVGASIATILCEFITAALLLYLLHTKQLAKNQAKTFVMMSAFFALALIVSSALNTCSIVATLLSVSIFSILTVFFGVIPWRMVKTLPTNLAALFKGAPQP